jgi:hypothetical protein
MELQAKIIQVLPVVNGTGKNSGKAFQKRDIIVEYGEQYPKQVCISLFNDKALAFEYPVGDVVNIKFDIASREYNGKYYTSVTAYEITLAQQAQQPVQYAQQPAQQNWQAVYPQPTAQPTMPPAPQAGKQDDLPF